MEAFIQNKKINMLCMFKMLCVKINFHCVGNANMTVQGNIRGSALLHLEMLMAYSGDTNKSH